MATAKTTTPWGPAELVEELTVRQQAGERRLASVVQLVETARGERLVRFADTTRGHSPARARDAPRARHREAARRARTAPSARGGARPGRRLGQCEGVIPC